VNAGNVHPTINDPNALIFTIIEEAPERLLTLPGIG
jgi:hypothetical protein